MGIFDKLEGRLERAYNGAFARAFKAEVQPVEIASAIRRAMDDRAVSTGKGRAQVPNIFTIELSETDYERLIENVDELDDELIAAAEEHADSQHYRPAGPVTIQLVEDVDLETGVFRLRPASARRPDATGYTGQQPRVRPGTGAGSRPGREDDGRDERNQDERGRGEHDDNRWSQDRRGPYDAAPADAGPAGTGRPGTGRAGAGPVAGASVAADAAFAVVPGAARADEPGRSADASEGAADVGPPRAKATDRPWLDIDGDRYLLVSARNIVGRDESCDVGLDDPGVSRRHAEVRVTIDGPHFVAAIRDLGSTNGTFVNGDRITTTHLQDGDRITVGRTTMTYRVRR